MKLAIAVLTLLTLAACSDGSASIPVTTPALEPVVAAPAVAASPTMAVTPSPSPTPTAAPTTAPTAAPTTEPAAASDICGVACVVNPQVTQATIGITICVTGWTATVRPSSTYTGTLKAQQMATLGLPGPATNYEEDHRLPLELGGNPTAARNLTPELRAAYGGTAETKDRDENAAKASVCSGAKTLLQAQADFIARWLAAWPGYRAA